MSASRQRASALYDEYMTEFAVDRLSVDELTTMTNTPVME